MAMIFISYSRKDREFIEFLEPRIHNIYGYASLWYDRAIQGGDDWWKRIVTEIRECQLFLFLVSNHSVESEFCRKELQKAIYNNKLILPVLLKTYTQEYPQNLPEELSEYMSEVQYIDLRKGYNDLSRLWGAINRFTKDRSISNIDRWILYNQFEILKRLAEQSDSPGNAKEYELDQKVISSGYEWNYDQISQHIHPPMEYGDCEEVIRVLEMYRAIYNACNRDVDCSKINSPYLRFRGFDGSIETNYYIYSEFMIEDRGLFQESKADTGSDLNSHTPMIDRYRKMLRKWELSEHKNALREADILRILED